ncbi:hypothetical protein OFB83_33585, partial [Escherichia coli]|nr:hypothetical protein [Escherichia coli]
LCHLLSHPPLLTKAAKVITMKIRSGFPVTQVLTRFSKNREDKRKSLLSKQELSALNAKKKGKKKKKETKKKKKLKS